MNSPSQPAVETDWDTLPLPARFAKVVLNRSFSAAEAGRIRIGLIPRQMEDKWFIYWQNHTLFMHRSWTGYCIYEIDFVATPDGITATEARVNRDSSQYECTSDEHDARLALYLIDALLLQKSVPFPTEEPESEAAALRAWSEIGRASIGAHPDDEDSGPEYVIGTNPMSLSAKVRRELAYYVYLYRDPRNGRVFYIGKGRGNRVLGHLKHIDDSKKGKLLAELEQFGFDPLIEILKYGLTEPEALLVESTAIDLLGLSNLTNNVRGHGSKYGGRGSLDEIVAQLDAKPVEITDPVILINISRMFHFTLTPQQLYDVTRSAWRVKPDSKAKYACGVYRGVVREVYRIQQWFPVGTTMRESDDGQPRRVTDKDQGRWEFVGHVAEEKVRNRYLGGSVARYFRNGARNPIRYVKC